MPTAVTIVMIMQLPWLMGFVIHRSSPREMAQHWRCFRTAPLNDEFTVSIVIARCTETAAGSLRWRIHLDTGLLPDITLAVRMQHQNQSVLDYYLRPTLDMTSGNLRLAEANGVSLDSYRFETLDQLFEMAARMQLLDVA
jgi:hypothetical protein